MLLGYNTNGFANHRLGDAIAIIAEIGFKSIAITLDHQLIDRPHVPAADRAEDRSPTTGLGVSPTADRAAAAIKHWVTPLDLRVTIETGSRFLLDPRRKHHPTLISRSPDDRRRRIDFLLLAIDIAAGVGADSVSLWSGAPDDAAEEPQLWTRLLEGLAVVLDHAESKDIRLAFEAEPGMFIDTMAKFGMLLERVNHRLLGLTLDVGHVHCLQDGDLRSHVERWQDKLWNVHIEDMKHGAHEHLMFGDGEMDFNSVFGALGRVSYTGPMHVELSRHSHDAVETARHSFAFLQSLADRTS
jgi:sugar phosphate isomerase/epimerase